MSKSVFITGATGDFGKAFAQKFSDEGFDLILHGRNADKLSDMKSTFPDAQIICFDITDEKAVIDALSDIKEVDVLINNAGGAIGLEPAYASALDDWLMMIDSNVRGLVAVTNIILPKMVLRGCGHIVNIGSTAGNYAYPGGHVYNGCKAFVKNFSGALRADLIDKNVRVTNIEPANVETEFSLKRFKGDQARADSIYAGANALQASDIAESVYWSVSQPAHVNITRMEIMPTQQANGPMAIHREEVA
ncbi:MAG: SDR family NAD(P)-dependent oxidoreductase [Bdellovibrionales bacterium]